MATELSKLNATQQNHYLDILSMSVTKAEAYYQRCVMLGEMSAETYYNSVMAEEDRNLSLEHMQRQQAREEAEIDAEIAALAREQQEAQEKKEPEAQVSAPAPAAINESPEYVSAFAQAIAEIPDNSRGKKSSAYDRLAAIREMTDNIQIDRSDDGLSL